MDVKAVYFSFLTCPAGGVLKFPVFDACLQIRYSFRGAGFFNQKDGLPFGRACQIVPFTETSKIFRAGRRNKFHDMKVGSAHLRWTDWRV